MFIGSNLRLNDAFDVLRVLTGSVCTSDIFNRIQKITSCQNNCVYFVKILEHSVCMCVVTALKFQLGLSVVSGCVQIHI